MIMIETGTSILASTPNCGFHLLKRDISHIS
jgi:hypothetical protein